MADFSVKATQVSPVANTVTPQSGVVDQSGEMILKGVGNALNLGVETYATIKTQQFAKDYEAVTRLGLGQEAVTDEEKQFQDRINRIDQTAKLGKVNTAKVLKEEFLRKSISEKPWFSARFQEMAGRVDGRYTDLVAAFQQAETVAASQATAIEKERAAARKTRVARVDGIGRTIGHEPSDINGNFKNYESMTDAELDWNEYQVQVKNHRMQVLGAARDDEKFRQENIKFGQSNTSFNNSQVSFYEERKGVRGNDLAAGEVSNAAIIISQQMTDWVNANPTSTKEQMSAAGVDFISQASQTVRKSLQILASQPGISLSPTEIENYVKGIEDSSNYYVDQVTGPTAPGPVFARQVKQLADQNGIAAYTALPILMMLKEAGVPLEPTTLAGMQSVLGTDVGVQATAKNNADIKKLFEGILKNPEAVYTPSGSAADVAVQAISTNVLVDAYRSNSPSYFALLKDPKAYVPLMLPAAVAWEAEPNEKNKAIIRDALTNPLILETVGKAHPSYQKQVYDAVKPILQTEVQRTYSPSRAPELVQSFDPNTGLFVAVPDNVMSMQYVDMANSMYRKAAILEMQINKDADPDRILRNYFGPKMADKFTDTAPTTEAQPQ